MNALLSAWYECTLSAWFMNVFLSAWHMNALCLRGAVQERTQIGRQKIQMILILWLDLRSECPKDIYIHRISYLCNRYLLGVANYVANYLGLFSQS